MIKFCSECGVKVEYKFSPPKFCSSCGAPMGVASVNESKPLNRNVRAQRKIEAIGEDQTDAESVPQISKLDYEIDTFGSEYVQTMGSLMGKEVPKKRVIQRKNINDV